MLIDLHFHSYYSSDADFSPTELVGGIAQKQGGLKIISLTDHDSVAGVGEFLQAGKAAGLEPVPGGRDHRPLSGGVVSYSGLLFGLAE